MGRFVMLVVILGMLVLVPFAIWGEGMEGMWTLSRLEGFGRWAWAVGLGLLIGDLLLPMPSTVVMSALGYLYGVLLGGLLASVGAFGSAMTGYGLCRWMGKPMARKLAGEKGLRQGEALFDRFGPWLVTLSRWLPILAEITACLAGMTWMPWRRFAFAAACGCVPLGFAFAWVGHLGLENPVAALLFSALAPALLWFLVVRRWMTPPPQN